MKTLIGVAVVVIIVGGAAVAWMAGEGDIVHSDPAPLSTESPFRYPIELWDRGVEGETTLMVHVTARGVVDTAYVLVSSGEPVLDSAAIAGSRDLRFAPARRGENRVAMWARLPVRFHQPRDSTDGGD